MQFQERISRYSLVPSSAWINILQSSRVIIVLWKWKKMQFKVLRSMTHYECTRVGDNLLYLQLTQDFRERILVGMVWIPLLPDCSVKKVSPLTGPLTGLHIGVSSHIKAGALWHPNSLAYSCRWSLTLKENKKLPNLWSFSSVYFLSAPLYCLLFLYPHSYFEYLLR